MFKTVKFTINLTSFPSGLKLILPSNLNLNKSNLPGMILVIFVSLVIVGLMPAFATPMPDSQWQRIAKNYAQIVSVANCNDPGMGGDSDDDGICDNWESSTNPGLHVNYTDSSTNTQYVYNLSCIPGNTLANDPSGLTVCPTTNKKDIYIELDTMTGHALDPQAMADVVKAFDKMGIALHIQLGEVSGTSSDIGVHYCFVNPIKATNTLNPITNAACSFSGSTPPSQSLPLIKKNFFGTVSERNGDTSICPSNQLPSDPTNGGVLLPVQNANSYNCLTAKRQVFHYFVAANNIVSSANTGEAGSGWAEVPGNDAVISLGSFTNGKGNIDEQESTLMHEIGHNLGLHHGGDLNPLPTSEADNNCKPNYLSVMSYTYQFRKTFDTCRPLAFSNSVLAQLNEQALNDTNLASTPYPSDNSQNPDTLASCPQSGERKIEWSTPSGLQQGTTGVTVDWNLNGNDSNTYSQNLNNLGINGCNTPNNTVLSGFNDTDFIYHGGAGATDPLVFRTSASSNFIGSTIATGEDKGNQTEGQGLNQFEDNAESTQPTTPAQPLLSGTTQSNNVHLSWTVSSDGGSPITGFELSRDSGSGSVIIATPGATTISFDDNNLQGGTYIYKVVAKNNIGSSTASSAVSEIIPITSPPCVGDCNPMPAYVAAFIIIGIIIVISIVSTRK